MGLELLAEEDGTREVVADTAYGSGEVLSELRLLGHRPVIKPAPVPPPTIPGGFTATDFMIDAEGGTCTCPAGHTTRITEGGRAYFGRFCAGCPLRVRCTQAKAGRVLNIHPHSEELRAARRQAETPEFEAAYRRWRPMAERSIAWVVRELRRLPYRGVDRNRLALAHRVTAINLQRLLNLGLIRGPDGWALAPTT